MQGLTGRAYARHQRVAAATVQDWRAKGWLVLFDDGSIDKAASDARVAEHRAAAQQDSAMSTARRRKLAVQVASLEDELDALSARLLDPAEAARARLEAGAYMVAQLLRIPASAAPLVAGRPAAVAKELLTDLIHATMDRLARTVFVAETAGEEPPAPAGEIDADLAARKTALSAERLELRRAVARGELLEQRDHVSELQGKIGTARARLLGLPGKLAPRLAMVGPAAAEAEIRKVILADVVAELAGPLPGVGNLAEAELLAAAEAWSDDD